MCACKLTDDEFEGAVEDALDSMPEEFADAFDNLIFMVQDEPEDWQLEVSGGSVSASGDLLGLYDGVSLYDRGNNYGAIDDLPDAITVFKGPHERLSDDKQVVLDEVRKTVIHEVGHYFGMTEEQIERMGYA